MILNFTDTDDDPCVYYNKGRSIIIALFVDDGLIAGKNREEIIHILERLNKKFKVTFDVGKENKLSYLSMQIQETEAGIFVNQPKYAEKILKRY